MIEEVRRLGMHYVFGAKPSDHPYLFEWLAAYPKLPTLTFTHQGKKHCYAWMNDVPLNGQKDAVRVNFLQCTILKENSYGEEDVVYKNSWVTDMAISEATIERLVKAGRCRWKNENEVFNVMKNQGYCMAHNYGHGQKHLAFNFYLLTLLAFYFHQIFELTDRTYQACRKKFGSKKSLWETLRSYNRIILFESWEVLLSFAWQPTDYQLIPQGQAP